MPESRADVHLGGEWTSTALGKDFFMAEDGQGEDRWIMFAMSRFSCIIYFIVYLYSKQYIKLLERSFFKSRRNATFWSKVGEQGISRCDNTHLVPG